MSQIKTKNYHLGFQLCRLDHCDQYMPSLSLSPIFTLVIIITLALRRWAGWVLAGGDGDSDQYQGSAGGGGGDGVGGGGGGDHHHDYDSQ